ncbi:MAG TPA: CPBP family intramembrane glutamic endopeptidase [Anaerolineales bacterium]|nr:CPBP family intramembrane glutamic endopeptidase [Anaerolineales bacterium]
MTNSNQMQYNSKLANFPRPAIAFTAIIYLLLGFLETLEGTFVPALLYFGALGILALYLMPYVFGLPNGNKSLREYSYDIRLLPMTPVGRNILLGLLMAALTLSSIYLASLLTGYFVLDWSTVPTVRWVKGLTRGIWEEVFFRGIILVLFMRVFPQRRAVFTSTFLFAIIHLNPMAISVEALVDVVSIFFIGLLFTYLVLKTGSLLPAIVFHYVHDIFVLLVQNTPGANEILASVLLYAFLWIALVLGAFLTKFIVERS